MKQNKVNIDKSYEILIFLYSHHVFLPHSQSMMAKK